jgi:hypothetical protein
LTIFAARNVCRSIFSSRRVRGSCGSAPSSSICVKLEDTGQWRIDLVCHAGSQQADRRHLFGDSKLLLELHSRGHVLDDDDRADRNTARLLGMRSGTTVALTISVSSARASARERDARQGGALRCVAASRTNRLDERPSKTSSRNRPSTSS